MGEAGSARRCGKGREEDMTVHCSRRIGVDALVPNALPRQDIARCVLRWRIAASVSLAGWVKFARPGLRTASNACVGFLRQWRFFHSVHDSANIVGHAGTSAVVPLPRSANAARGPYPMSAAAASARRNGGIACACHVRACANRHGNGPHTDDAVPTIVLPLDRNPFLMSHSVYLGAKEYFPGIGRIPFEGKASDNPLAHSVHDSANIVGHAGTSAVVPLPRSANAARGPYPMSAAAASARRNGGIACACHVRACANRHGNGPHTDDAVPTIVLPLDRNPFLMSHSVYLGAKEYFPGIGRIPFEGKASDNPLAFVQGVRRRQADWRQVHGRAPAFCGGVLA